MQPNYRSDVNHRGGATRLYLYLPPKLSYVTQKLKKCRHYAVLPIMTRNALVLRPLIFYALDLFDNKNIRAPRWFVTLEIIMKRKPLGWPRWNTLPRYQSVEKEKMIMYCWSDRHKRRQSWCQTKDATFVCNKNLFPLLELSSFVSSVSNLV